MYSDTVCKVKQHFLSLPIISLQLVLTYSVSTYRISNRFHPLKPFSTGQCRQSKLTRSRWSHFPLFYKFDPPACGSRAPQPNPLTGIVTYFVWQWKHRYAMSWKTLVCLADELIPSCLSHDYTDWHDSGVCFGITENCRGGSCKLQVKLYFRLTLGQKFDTFKSCGRMDSGSYHLDILIWSRLYTKQARLLHPNSVKRG